ncbi:MAG: hypothetical protein QHH04_04960 [Methanolinea sp.]|nr:hypothetical protein [Methanolinea sp.]
MRTSSVTMLLIAVLMIIIILALIVIIGLTVMLKTGGASSHEESAIMQFVTFSQEQAIGIFDAIRQWFDYLIVQIQKISEYL